MREQFTFYRSYYLAIKEMKKTDVASLVLAICAYALDGEEPKLSDNLKGIFELVRPTLNASARKSENGKKGGRPEKQTESKRKANGKLNESKQKANGKQTESEKENEVENEVEVEYENECYISSSASPPKSPECDPELSETICAYKDAFGEYLSYSAMQEIAHTWFKHFGKSILLYALDVAKDNGKLSWAYIRAVLIRWKQDGLTSIAEIQADAEAREKAKNGGVKSADSRGLSQDSVSKWSNLDIIQFE